MPLFCRSLLAIAVVTQHAARCKHKGCCFHQRTVINLLLWGLLRATPRNKHSREVAGVTGLEPATSGVTGRHSNQLSYTPVLVQRVVIDPLKTKSPVIKTAGLLCQASKPPQVTFFANYFFFCGFGLICNFGASETMRTSRCGNGIVT